MHRLALARLFGAFAITLLPTHGFAQDSANVIRAKQDIRQLVTAVNLFQLDNARFPHWLSR